MASTSRSEERSEIAFFDVSTTVPTRVKQGRVILEFAAILVSPRTLVELNFYSTPVRPANLSLIESYNMRCNVASAPTFSDIADRVYNILQGRVWAGHNIRSFDCPLIRKAFGEIGRPAPEPKSTIDSFALLTKWFGKRAGDMKLATLADYFGLGPQTHKCLDDVRLNLEVLKCCATVLFLESSLPDIFTENSWVSPNATTEEVEPSAQQDPFNMGLLISESESLEPVATMEEMVESSEYSSTAAVSDSSSDSGGFLKPDEVSISAIVPSFVPFYRGSQRIQLLHKGVILQLGCINLKVRFGLSTRFVDHAGRPRLNFVVNASQSLCKVLDACDGIVKELSLDSGSSSEWRPVVSRKDGFVNNPTVRLHVPTSITGDGARYATEIYQKESSGTVQKLVFSKFDAAELEPLFTPGTFLDAFFSLDPYDYQQNAGIRLVAKKLIVGSN